MKSVISNMKNSIQKHSYVTNVIGKDEYNKYTDLYDNLYNLNLNQDYKNILIERFKNLNDDVKKVYNIYANQLKFLETNYNKTANFNATLDGIRFNETLDYNNQLGSGNTFFHESAHMIDWLAGKNGITITQLNNLTNEAQADYNDALSKIMTDSKCKLDEAQKKLTGELILAKNEANCVSDIFGGLSGNKVKGIWGHRENYWFKRDKTSIGKEAFAEITADLSCNINNYEFTKKYMPRTISMYEKIIKSL